MAEIAYDVFISHAFEDKNTFTNALAVELKKKGLKVWYSGSELKLGDSIMLNVNNALNSAKYAVVVISPIYLEKTWAMNELRALFAQEADHKRILPILHNISIEEIKKYLPLIADRYAISSTVGQEFIVAKILEVVTGEKDNTDKRNSSPQSSKKSSNPDGGFITLGRNPANSSAQTRTTHWLVKAIIIGIIGLALSLFGFFIKKNYKGNNGQPAVINDNTHLINGNKVK